MCKMFEKMMKNPHPNYNAAQMKYISLWDVEMQTLIIVMSGMEDFNAFSIKVIILSNYFAHDCSSMDMITARFFCKTYYCLLKWKIKS